MHAQMGAHRFQFSRKFQTCRYWAFGPACPNIDAHGVDICPYAHWDTGALSHHYDQRGTCQQWLNTGGCQYGARCFYEHRYTGYIGLYQGPIQLAELDLKVADAAAKAGFDTCNHAALFDLLWAVRRITRWAPYSSIDPRPAKPSDPIYPDRYRPSGFGDNTKKRRRGNPTQNATTANMTEKPLETEPPKTANQQGDVYIDLTSPGIIDLTTSPEAKRRKVRPQAEVTLPKRLPSQTNTPMTKPKSTTAPSMAAARNASATVYLPAKLNLPPPRDSPSVIKLQPSSLVSHRPAKAARRPNEDLLRRLALVKLQLTKIADMGRNCQNTMHDLFENHEVLQRLDVQDDLKTLSRSLGACHEAAGTAVENMKTVVDFVGDQKSDVVL